MINATKAQAAPKKKVAEGDTLSHRKPAIKLAGRLMTPKEALNNPYAVPLLFSGTIWATRDFATPSVVA